MTTKTITFVIQVEDKKDEIKDTVDVCIFFGWLDDIMKQHNAKLVSFKVNKDKQT